MTRAKFKVETKNAYPDGKGANIEMRAVYSEDPNHENKAFWDATPSGYLQMSIKSSAAEMFEVGKEYYLDISPADNGGA